MIIKTRNLLSELAPKTYLSSTEAAGTTVFRMKNTTAFGSAWALQIGETNNEQTEVLLLSGTPSGTVGTSTVASLFEHPADTPVYAIKYNQVIFERSTTGTAGTATPIGTVTYQADSPYTQFDDTTGATTYAYRARFQYPGGSSSQSNWITPSGFSFYSLASIRQRIKDKLWDSSYIKEDLVIDNWVNEMKDEMTNSVISVNQDYALGTVDVGFGTSGLGTITTTNFSFVRRFEVTYNSIDYVLSKKSYVSQFPPSQVFSSVSPHHHYVGDTVFKVQPPESGGTARLTYYQFGTVLVEDTDELPQPMKSFTKAFVDYGVEVARFKDGKSTLADVEAIMMRAKQDFINKLTPRDQSSASSIQIVEPISGDDYY